MRLIDADELYDKAEEKYKDSSGFYRPIYRGFVDDVANAPTVDAVPVVRCKDCKHWKPGDSWGGDSLDDMQRIGGCPIVRFARRENDFCCCGERRG